MVVLQFRHVYFKNTHYEGHHYQQNRKRTDSETGRFKMPFFGCPLEGGGIRLLMLRLLIAGVIIGGRTGVEVSADCVTCDMDGYDDDSEALPNGVSRSELSRLLEGFIRNC